MSETAAGMSTAARMSETAVHASMSLWHVAVSVADLRASQRWYSDTLGLTYARGTSLMAGPLLSWTLALRGAATSCWWLNDRQDLFQLEMFEFRRPLTRALPAGWRRCDIGYAAISVHVEDLDAALERAARNGSPALAPALGGPGVRRACVRDPDGVLVELMEDDPRETSGRPRPRPEVPAVVRCVTLSVADLERSRRLFVEGLGLSEAAEIELHRPEHEALWGLEGALCDTVLLWAGDFLVELVSYRRPPAASREPGWRINDRGLFHICFGSFEKAQFQAVLQRCRALGCRGNSPVISVGASASQFLLDEEGFAIELLYRHPRLRQAPRAKPRSTPRLMPLRVRAPAGVRRRRRFASAAVIGADTAIGVELCRLMAEDGTSLWLPCAPDTLIEMLRSRTGASARADDIAVSRARLEALAPAGGASEPELIVGLAPAPRSTPNGQREPGALWSGQRESDALSLSQREPSSLEALALFLPLAGDALHVTAIVDRSARRELAVLRALLAHMSCTSTLATLSYGAPGYLANTPLERALLLTAREAAEAIYLVTLRRAAAPCPRPSVWPPSRGASEAPTSDGVLLGPPTRERPRDALGRLPELA